LDEAPWPDVLDLLDYWEFNPPVHRMVAAFMGIEADSPEEPQAMESNDLQAWAQQFQ